MKDVQDMTDEEWWLHRAREWAAGIYRAEGHEDFARRVGRGEKDSCSLVRLGRFFIEPSQPHDEEFVADWNDWAAARASR